MFDVDAGLCVHRLKQVLFSLHVIITCVSMLVNDISPRTCVEEMRLELRK